MKKTRKDPKFLGTLPVGSTHRYHDGLGEYVREVVVEIKIKTNGDRRLSSIYQCP